MNDSLKIALGIVIGVVGLIALVAICTFCFLGSLLLNVPKPPTLAPVGIVPPASTLTPASTSVPNNLGQSITYQDVKTTIIEYQFSSSYKNKYGGNVNPPEKAKFLWLHLSTENVGQVAVSAPSSYQFKLIYKATNVTGALYLGDRSGYPAYQSSSIYPGVRVDGWVQFNLPQDARPEDIQVSYNVGNNPFTPVEFLWQLR